MRFQKGQAAWNKGKKFSKESIHKLPNILISIPSVVVGMNINQFSGLCIMAVMAVFVLTVTAISVTPAAIAQNMTGGNMTGGNMTGGNISGFRVQ
jgi:hypothetical protein